MILVNTLVNCSKITSTVNFLNVHNDPKWPAVTLDHMQFKDNSTF